MDAGNNLSHTYYLNSDLGLNLSINSLRIFVQYLKILHFHRTAKKSSSSAVRKCAKIAQKVSSGNVSTA